MLVNLAQLAFTSDLRAVEYITGSWLVGGVGFSKPRMIAFVFAAAVTALSFLVLKFTRLGKALPATSQRREVAVVCGGDGGRVPKLHFRLAPPLAAGGG